MKEFLEKEWTEGLDEEAALKLTVKALLEVSCIIIAFISPHLYQLCSKGCGFWKQEYGGCSCSKGRANGGFD